MYYPGGFLLHSGTGFERDSEGFLEKFARVFFTVNFRVLSIFQGAGTGYISEAFQRGIFRTSKGGGAAAFSTISGFPPPNILGWGVVHFGGVEYILGHFLFQYDP